MLLPILKVLIKNKNLKNVGSSRRKIIINLIDWVPEAPQN